LDVEPPAPTWHPQFFQTVTLLTASATLFHPVRLTQYVRSVDLAIHPSKLDNFQAAVALNFGYYNFCKRHISVKTTPAKAAGIEDHEWTVGELVERCGDDAGGELPNCG